MDDKTRWPKWIGWTAAAVLSAMLWGVGYMIWQTLQKI